MQTPAKLKLIDRNVPEDHHGQNSCRGPESNRHGRFQPGDFKSHVSTNFTTPAMSSTLTKVEDFDK